MDVLKQICILAFTNTSTTELWRKTWPIVVLGLLNTYEYNTVHWNNKKVQIIHEKVTDFEIDIYFKIFIDFSLILALRQYWCTVAFPIALFFPILSPLCQVLHM